MKAVFLDTGSLDCDDIDFSALHELPIELEIWKQTSTQQREERIRFAEIVITNKVVLDEKLIKSAENLKLICIAATGTNNVDLKAANNQSIQVCNVTGYATASVVQHVFSLLTSLQGRLATHHQAAIGGEWARSTNFCVLDYSYSELHGKIFGIIGYGELGKAVANVAQSFGMKLLVAERPYKNENSGGDNQEIVTPSGGCLRVPLKTLISESDVVSLHCPLVEDTRDLINAKIFGNMKHSALLINTARGGIVNEIDLLLALQAGAIGGAALDVLETEPPPESHPLFSYQGSNLIITPHIAWASRESRQRLLDQLVSNILSYFSGPLRNLVT